jgi:hypothetical protein
VTLHECQLNNVYTTANKIENQKEKEKEQALVDLGTSA